MGTTHRKTHSYRELGVEPNLVRVSSQELLAEPSFCNLRDSHFLILITEGSSSLSPTARREHLRTTRLALLLIGGIQRRQLCQISVGPYYAQALRAQLYHPCIPGRCKSRLSKYWAMP
jgi:hypothetical protein